MSASGSLVAAGAFARTRLRAARLHDRRPLERWQERQLHRWMRERAIAVPATSPFAAELRSGRLDALPVIGKLELLDRFAAYNTLGLAAAEALAMADGGRPPPGYWVGASTGTSGNRLPYVISERERFVWLGTLLAKALAGLPPRRHRVAVVLPRGSALYDAATASRALTLLFVPIGDGLERMAQSLEDFRPTLVVAPPRALRWLAERGTAIAPDRVFSAAEVLDPFDRRIIEVRFARERPLGEIYMATEGLFAVTCASGTLHLTEDCVHFELEPAGDGLVSPVVTDFSRTSQIMARYRMNDLLRPGPPCPCGSPMRTILQVEGRCDDAFEIAGASGPVTVTPDVVRDAVVGASPAIDDFRAVQVGPRSVELRVRPDLDGTVAAAASTALERAVRRAGAEIDVTLVVMPLSPPIDRKLRRVERAWRPLA